jgi:hypothetical protein
MPVAHYPRYRFPPAIISHAVWLYYRSTPVSATSKTPLAQRGITVSYESIRHWCESFGAASRTVGRLVHAVLDIMAGCRYPSATAHWSGVSRSTAVADPTFLA